VMARPTDPLTEMEKRVFGEHAVRHPVTGEPQEDGSGSVRHEERVALAAARNVAVREVPADVPLETALERLADPTTPIASPPDPPAPERLIDARFVFPFPPMTQ
jgi:hypothetical protein